jgi:hypothetical protein
MSSDFIEDINVKYTNYITCSQVFILTSRNATDVPTLVHFCPHPARKLSSTSGTGHVSIRMFVLRTYMWFYTANPFAGLMSTTESDNQTFGNRRIGRGGPTTWHLTPLT